MKRASIKIEITPEATVYNELTLIVNHSLELNFVAAINRRRARNRGGEETRGG